MTVWQVEINDSVVVAKFQDIFKSFFSNIADTIAAKTIEALKTENQKKDVIIATQQREIHDLQDKIDDKGIKNGCPCIVEIRGTQGCALVGDPARAVGECRDVAKAQPSVPLISIMHGQPFLIPFITWNIK